jgi:hypothetical protein
MKARARELPKDLARSEILALAEKGDRSVLPAVREILDRAPELTLELGDLDSTARSAMLDLLAGDHLIMREAQARAHDDLLTRLEGPSPTLLEHLVATQIALCWQQTRLAEIQSARDGDCSIPQRDYHQRRADHAQKRYLRAIRALAELRRLNLTLPPMQINVAMQGGKQVNAIAPL